MNPALERRVPVVLDGIVGPPGKELGNLCPSVSNPRVRSQNDHILDLCPRTLKDGRVDVVVPSLTALLPNPSGERLGNHGPLDRPMLLNKETHTLILLGRPRTFVHLPFARLFLLGLSFCHCLGRSLQKRNVYL